MSVIIDSRRDITLDTVHKVAWRRQPVELSEPAVQRMTAARQRFMELLDNDPDVTIYGVTTGYGQMAKRKLSPEERRTQARQPSFAAAASWGDPVPERVSRAMVLARLANFVDGHAAVSPHVAKAVADMLSLRELPKVPARGQGGAGEILSLSHLFVDLSRTVELAEKDGISLINGSPAASALVADIALSAERRLQVAAELFALSADAFDCPLGHFAEQLEDQWNNDHDTWALRTVRQLLPAADGRERRPYQAPVSFRILPRMLGQAHRAWSMARDVAGESLAAVTDNPVYLDADDDHPFGQFISTGGYHNAQAVMAMDAVTAAYANLCVIAERHAAKLLDGNVSLLPDHLIESGDYTDVRHGYLGCLAMALTGYEEEARHEARATLLPGSESGGFGQNDIASPVFLAWTKAERAGSSLDLALASLAPIALRAFKVTDRQVTDQLSHWQAPIVQAFPGLEARQPLGPHAAELAAFLNARIYDTA
jgi:histidine ammonia-lyase